MLMLLVLNAFLFFFSGFALCHLIHRLLPKEDLWEATPRDDENLLGRRDPWLETRPDRVEPPIATLSDSRWLNACEVCGEPAGTSPFLCPDHAMEREREEWDGPPQI